MIPDIQWLKQGTGAATLRNLNIVQNGKSSKPAFRSMYMWKSRFQGFNFVGICRKASLFFSKKQEPNFLTRDILFEI